MEGNVVEYRTDFGNGVGVITGKHEHSDKLWNIITKGGMGCIKEENIIRVFNEQEIAKAVYEMYIPEERR